MNSVYVRHHAKVCTLWEGLVISSLARMLRATIAWSHIPVMRSVFVFIASLEAWHRHDLEFSPSGRPPGRRIVDACHFCRMKVIIKSNSDFYIASVIAYDQSYSRKMPVETSVGRLLHSCETERDRERERKFILCGAIKMQKHLYACRVKRKQNHIFNHITFSTDYKQIRACVCVCAFNSLYALTCIMF